MKRLISISIVLLAFICSCNESEDPNPENPGNMPYVVEIDPDDFVSSGITGNDFFSLEPGRTLVYEGEDDGGAVIRVEELYTGDTKLIMGVTCVVVSAKEYRNDKLIEDTYDWYAQDNSGNVWYFGEDTKEIKNGEVVSTHGSWEAGADDALPGIIMLANPLVGLWYRQEYFKDEAEDVAQVLSLNATVTVPYGTFTNCIQTAEWSLLEPGVVEHKFYAPGVGLLRSAGVKGESDYEDLKEIIN